MEFVEKVAKFGFEDFRAMFTLHDLAIGELFGDYALNRYDVETSPRLILVARKRGVGCSVPGAPGQDLREAA